jgi:cation transport regulator ChaC
MSFRRYEILPTRYNDGTAVEPEKYLITRREIAARFGALTFLPQPIHGEWMHQEARYEDVNLRIVVDVEDTPENAEFFVRLKQTLKERFQQIEIWIVSYEIRIV